MNAVLLLILMVGSCECRAWSQPKQAQQNPGKTSGNHTQYVSINEMEIQVLVDKEKFEMGTNEDTRVHDYRSEGVNRMKHNIYRLPTAYQRLEYILSDTEAKLLEMNKRHPNRVELKTLSGLTWLQQEVMSWINTTSHQSRECTFVCPEAESLAPCSCDPCNRSINCSLVDSFEQLFDIFHTASFPDPRFESFLLVAPLRMSSKATSDVFLANTFGYASFASITVEGMTDLRVVEAGGFNGSEARLRELIFRWNSGLTIFPFTEVGKMELLVKLEVSGSSITSVPVFPHAPKLTILYLPNNPINYIPQKAFAELPSLMLLDLGFNRLQGITEGSLHFSAQDVLLYLDHNAIDYIHETAFSGLQPAGLDVSCNALTALDQKVFQPILDYIIDQQYNSYVDASCNPLQCSYINWLLENSIYLSYIILPEPPCVSTT